MYLSWQEGLSSPVLLLAQQEQCGCTSLGSSRGEMGCGIWQFQTPPANCSSREGVI